MGCNTRSGGLHPDHYSSEDARMIQGLVICNRGCTATCVSMRAHLLMSVQDLVCMFGKTSLAPFIIPIKLDGASCVPRACFFELNILELHLLLCHVESQQRSISDTDLHYLNRSLEHGLFKNSVRPLFPHTTQHAICSRKCLTRRL